MKRRYKVPQDHLQIITTPLEGKALSLRIVG